MKKKKELLWKISRQANDHWFWGFLMKTFVWEGI